jgi:two-component system response regulator YesN
VSITIAKGIPAKSISLCGESLLSAETTLKQRILLGVNRILSPVQHTTPRLTKEVFNVEKQRAMKKSIESFDMQALTQQMEEIFTGAELLDTSDASFFWGLCKDIADFFWNTLLNMRIVDEIDRVKKDEDLHQLLDGCSNLRQMQYRFIGFLPQQFRLYYDTEHPPENVAVMIAKKYITNHYREKISLKDISEHVYLNPVYFSICFKRDTGLTFVDYVNEYRIEKSKEHLKSRLGNIQSVAENVGFLNVRYFSKVFKRYVGLTPAEYRKKYSNYE